MMGVVTASEVRHSGVAQSTDGHPDRQLSLIGVDWSSSTSYDEQESVVKQLNQT